MERKKLDRNSIIGFVIIAGLLIWMMLNNVNKEKEAIKTDSGIAEKEQVEQQKQVADVKEVMSGVVANDSVAHEQIDKLLGQFAYSAKLPSANEEAVTTIKNEKLSLTVGNKGGLLTNVTILGITTSNEELQGDVQLIKDQNADFNLELYTTDNHTINTRDLFFAPELTKEGENQVLTMRLKVSESKFLEYRYVLKPDNYMIDFSVRTQGLNDVLAVTKAPQMTWSMTTYRNEKSTSYENRYTHLYYEHEGDKTNDLSATSKDDTKAVKDVSFIAYKQHFFTSILLTDKAFENTTLNSKNLVESSDEDAMFTKSFESKIPLAYTGGELVYDFNMFFGPSDYDLLKSYDKNLDEIVPLGWGIFGWLNRFLFIPVFGVLSSFLPYGISIIVLTILVRLLISPLTYKSYVSQAKMKVIRPEVAEINEKFKNDPMKKQQETMSLYSKAGVNPMAGCIPAVLQIPIFYALFQFFPSAFDLRQKSFLWADDLSSYDSVYHLPFKIPFYGDHVSLFPLLASIAIFIYMKMTTGDQQMAQPQQEGMPDMGKLMKIMVYISPIMMLFFFNNYASGLSLYYFVSNSITIGIMYVIKNHIVKEEKIKAGIEENKTKKKPQGKFQRKMQAMMEQAQEQQRTKDQNKK